MAMDFVKGSRWSTNEWNAIVGDIIFTICLDGSLLITDRDTGKDTHAYNSKDFVRFLTSAATIMTDIKDRNDA